MAKIENFRPKLKAGRLVPQRARLVYELEEPLEQIVLPIESIDFLLLCNGTHTVQEIIELLYHRKGHIQFKSIFKTLRYLRDRGFLDNGEQLTLPDDQLQSEKSEFLQVKPVLELPIGRRIFNDNERPGLFYILAMMSLLSAILSFQLMTKGWLSFGFLRIEESYWKGLVFLFCMSSALLSFKNFFKSILLLFLTGRAYNFSFVFNGLAAYFRVRSDSLFLVTSKLYLLLFHLAVVTCYFPLIAAVYFFFPDLPYLNEALSLGFFLFLFDLNPFQDSEISFLLKATVNDDTMTKLSSYLKSKSLISLLHPFERGRDASIYFLLTKIAALWSVVVLFCIYVAVGYHFEGFLTTLRSGTLIDRIAALGSSSYLVTLCCVVMFNLGQLIYLTAVVPATRFLSDRRRKQKSHKLEFFNHREIISQLEELPLFSYFSRELLDMIVHRSDLKEYNADTPVIVQGDEGRHLFVLLSGELQVRKRHPSGKVQRISEIHPPTIFGEVAVIDDCRRTAEVAAKSRSIVLEIPARMLKELAEDSQYIRELDSFRNAIMVNQFFTSAPVFRDLPESIVRTFVSRGKIESYNPNDIIFKQGDTGDGFYLLLRGSVGVSVNGKPVARIKQGGFFGEISMIADVPRTGTVYALEAAQVLKISRDGFWEILSQNIAMAMFIESIGEMRIREDIEVLRGGKARVA